jgi:hypothetical protein
MKPTDNPPIQLGDTDRDQKYKPNRETDIT